VFFGIRASAIGDLLAMEQVAFIHFSDVHFGPVMANNQFSFIHGYDAHDLVLCTAIPQALEDVRTLLEVADDEQLNVVVSGDVTSEGSPQNFTVAHSYLRSTWRLRREPPGNLSGLNRQTDEIGIIPGNHDHWNGKRFPPPAYSKSIFPAHFRPTPWKKIWKSTAGNVELEIYGIDSNSGLQGTTNLMAKGAISSHELRALDVLLAESDQRILSQGAHRVRAIVTHHSLSYTGGVAGKEKLDDSSRDDLLEIAAKYRISSVLTGHGHDFHFQPLVGTYNGTQRVVHELRSATTLQGPALPFSRGQGFWAHRIRLVNSGMIWSSWRYAWDGSRFVPRNRSAPCVQFPV
jgi:hypothetical protein